MDNLTQVGMDRTAKGLESSYENFLNRAIQGYKIAYAWRHKSQEKIAKNQGKVEGINLPTYEEVAPEAEKIWQEKGYSSAAEDFRIFPTLDGKPVEWNPEMAEVFSSVIESSNGESLNHGDWDNVQIDVVYYDPEQREPIHFENLFSTYVSQEDKRVKNLLDSQLVSLVEVQAEDEPLKNLNSQSPMQVVADFWQELPLGEQTTTLEFLKEVNSLLKEQIYLRQKLRELTEQDEQFAVVVSERLAYPHRGDWWTENLEKLKDLATSTWESFRREQQDQKYAQILDRNLKSYFPRHQETTKYLGEQGRYSLSYEPKSRTYTLKEATNDLLVFRQGITGYQVLKSNLEDSPLKNSLEWVVRNPAVRGENFHFPLDLLPVEEVVKRLKIREKTGEIHQNLQEVCSCLKEIVKQQPEQQIQQTFPNGYEIKAQEFQGRTQITFSQDGKDFAILKPSGQMIINDYNCLNNSSEFFQVAKTYYQRWSDKIEKMKAENQGKKDLFSVWSSLNFLREKNPQLAGHKFKTGHEFKIQEQTPAGQPKETRVTFYKNGEPIATVTGNHLRTEISINEKKKFQESQEFLTQAKNYFNQWQKTVRENLQNQTPPQMSQL